MFVLRDFIGRWQAGTQRFDLLPRQLLRDGELPLEGKRARLSRVTMWAGAARTLTGIQVLIRSQSMHVKPDFPSNAVRLRSAQWRLAARQARALER